MKTLDHPVDKPYRNFDLEHGFTATSGAIWMSGIQALARLPLDQHKLDKARGLNTAGYVTGYRGSPLGGLDRAILQNDALYKNANVVFQPGINEDLAATATWGTQQTELFPGAKYQGVFGMWYGKAPGLDRSLDVFRHANAAGTSQLGGVLAVVGDDPACKSSTLPSASQGVLRDVSIPVLSPSHVGEIIEYGLFGWAISRYSGSWAGLLVTTPIVDSSTNLNIDIFSHVYDELDLDNDLHISLQHSPNDLERKRLERTALIEAFSEANPINRVEGATHHPRLVIVTSGKTYVELWQACQLLGISNEEELSATGIQILKLGMIWPLAEDFIRNYCTRSPLVMVLEEKGPFLEKQLKSVLYGAHAPQLVGARDQQNQPLISPFGVLTATDLVKMLARVMSHNNIAVPNSKVLEQFSTTEEVSGDLAQPVNAMRQPLYCAGCPHSRSTRVPKGSRANAGIGCHYMALWMDRETFTPTQMGGEGVNWIGQVPFTNQEHIFVNLGDGTYYHSGYMAIRAAIAAGVNITFKVLFNDAVAMTGGQAIDGPLTVESLVTQIKAEGVNDVRVVSYDPSRHREAPFKVFDRSKLDEIQRSLRNTPGVTVLVYDQPCANELRRKRKRGLVNEAAMRVIIHESVCEGCGDCTAVSNCVAIESIKTEFGEKRRINQSSCNQDLSCVEGFCPSFVGVKGQLRKKDFKSFKLPADLPVVQYPENVDIFITGVGGTGVITLSQVLSVAAHIEGKQVFSLDMTGLAQKGGAVFSHVRIGTKQIHRTEIADTTADVLIAADPVVAASKEALAKVSADRTSALLNDHVSATANFVIRGEKDFETESLSSLIQQQVKNVRKVDAQSICESQLGTTTCTNIFLLGYAWQSGLIPVSASSIEHALKLNRTAIEMNIAAFRLGRSQVFIESTTSNVSDFSAPSIQPLEKSIEEFIAFRSDFLRDYQNTKYAEYYRSTLDEVTKTQSALGLENHKFARTVAQSYFRVMACKDEYEVARLLTHDRFMAELRSQYESGFKLQFHIAPSWLPRSNQRKIAIGAWAIPVFRLLALLRFLRGSVFDIFRFSAERKLERVIRQRFEQKLHYVIANLTQSNIEAATEWAKLYQTVKGYGHIKEKSWETLLTNEPEMLDRFQQGSSNKDPTSTGTLHGHAA